MKEGRWVICIKTYKVDEVEIPKGRMDYSYARFPVSGLWRAATEEEIKTKEWHRGHYSNLNNV